MVDRNVTITQSVARSVSIGDAVISPYDPIDGLNPDFYVPLKYELTTADGQILYQDSAETTGVTAASDPVGSVNRDGTLVTQSTDADRPIWQGESRGCSFDGSTQRLANSDTSTLAFIHNTATGCIAFRCALDSPGGAFYTVTGNAISGGQTGFLLRFDDSGTPGIAFAINIGGGFVTATSTGMVSDTDMHDYVLNFDPSEVQFYQDNTLIDTVAWSPPTTAGDSTNGVAIGAPAPGSTATPMDGDILEVFYRSTELNASERATYSTGPN